MGERIRTDRRDASNVARLHRAGELTPVWVPDPAHEPLRDLVRARLAAVRTLRQARQQLSGFLLRHGRHYARPAWTGMHRRWLAGLRFEQAMHHIVPGAALVNAATLLAELGDITRFASPRHLMASLGLVSSEQSSGQSRRQGGITKAGNGALCLGHRPPGRNPG